MSRNFNIMDSMMLQSSRVHAGTKQSAKTNQITVFHQNVRSVKGNSRFEDAVSTVRDISTNIDVIIMTETWLNNAIMGFFNIDGYRKEFYCRNTKNGGGILVFIKDHIDYERRLDLQLPGDSAESVVRKIKNSSKNSRKDPL